MYRGDKYKPKEKSWESLLFDKRLRNKITLFDEGVAIIKIGGLINGVENPNHMTQAEIDKAAQTMIKARPNIASFWQSETQAMQDFNSGKVWATYAWPDTYAQVITEQGDEGRARDVHAAQGGHARLDLLVRDRRRARRTRTWRTSTSTSRTRRRRWSTSSTRSTRVAPR